MRKTIIIICLLFISIQTQAQTDVFNALLKTIEEPPSFVKFIFCTTELQKIPITIVSRCQKYDLNRVSLEEISKFLIKSLIYYFLRIILFLRLVFVNLITTLLLYQSLNPMKALKTKR